MLQNFICLTGYVTEEMFIYDEIEMRQAFWETGIYKKKLNPILDEEEKLSWIFIFALFCGVSKGFMKALKALKKKLQTIDPFDDIGFFLYPMKT